MTVKELIERLQDFPEEWRVAWDGPVRNLYNITVVGGDTDHEEPYEQLVLLGGY